MNEQKGIIRSEENSLSMQELLTKENYPELSGEWDTPCMICEYLEKCNIGQEFNPIGCPWLNHYLILQINE